MQRCRGDCRCIVSVVQRFRFRGAAVVEEVQVQVQVQRRHRGSSADNDFQQRFNRRGAGTGAEVLHLQRSRAVQRCRGAWCRF